MDFEKCRVPVCISHDLEHVQKDRHTNGEVLQTEGINFPKNMLCCDLWFMQLFWQILQSCGKRSRVNWSFADVSEYLAVMQHVTDV